MFTFISCFRTSAEKYYKTFSMSNLACNFQSFLKQELHQRSCNNNSYSIRAFARDLGVNDSTLSKLLTGKLTFSAKRVQVLGARLGLCQDRIKEFVVTLNSRYKASKSIDFEQLRLDQFNCASEWYNDAIIELAKIENTKPDAKEISKLLGISFIQARESVERLIRLGLIFIDDEGDLKCNLDNSLTNYDENIYTNELLRQYQKQILKKSLNAVDDVEKSKRSHNSMILSVDSSKINELHDLMRKQQQELLTFMEENSSKNDTVYALQFSSFPLVRSK